MNYRKQPCWGLFAARYRDGTWSWVPRVHLGRRLAQGGFIVGGLSWGYWTVCAGIAP